MKLLVLSDTHGYLSNARDVLNRIGKYMNGVIHLGDHAYDAADLQTEYPDLPFYIVRGNNDFGDKAPNKLMITIHGKRLLLTHGHMQQVYWSYDTISSWRCSSAYIWYIRNCSKWYALWFYYGIYRLSDIFKKRLVL